jgi:hypothetical protein
MPNSPRSSKMWCRSDANPVSCNWGLRHTWGDHSTPIPFLHIDNKENGIIYLACGINVPIFGSIIDIKARYTKRWWLVLFGICTL